MCVGWCFNGESNGVEVKVKAKTFEQRMISADLPSFACPRNRNLINRNQNKHTCQGPRSEEANSIQLALSLISRFLSRRPLPCPAFERFSATSTQSRSQTHFFSSAVSLFFVFNCFGDSADLGEHKSDKI